MSLQSPFEAATDERKALTRFVMDNAELVKLEGLLGRFNVFRVLRAARHELRHSNMLAWLLDPEETHGLGDRFLRRWLMEVVHNASQSGSDPSTLPSPIEVDVLDIEYVDVARESANIDLLLLLTTGKGTTWVVCIENKVNSVQHTKQLERYRAHVERRHPAVEQALFIFLSKGDEDPEDPKWITSTYAEIAGVLRKCLEERGTAIGDAPHLLMTQYLHLLEEDFVVDSESVELARKIYQRHKRAIDFILENRDDPVLKASNAMREMLTSNTTELDIVIGVCNKGWTRFLPSQWDVPENRGGTAWGPNSRYVVCEVCFWTKKVELHVVAGRAPDYFADALWARAASAPFKQEWKKRPVQFIKPYKARSDIPVEALSESDPDDMRKQLHDWIREELKRPQFGQVVEIIRDMLPSLKR